MNVITLDSVTRSYGSAKVLENFSLEVARGERIVILGPSGCGKTTFLRLLAGFAAPDAGTIFLGGELVAGDGRILVPPERRRVGMVFQDLALWPHLDVKGNLELGLKAKGLRKKERAARITEMLELVGLAGYGKRKPDALSGGQQQRVALARALALEPDVLLMDEPLSSLDAKLNRRLRKEILRLQEKLGFTLLYVTHDREEAGEIASRVVRMGKD